MRKAWQNRGETMNRRNNDLAMDDDWLDRALAESGRAHRAVYIADNGFAARVAAALPAPAAIPAWRRPAVAMLWAIAAGGVAVALPGAVVDAAREVLRLMDGIPVSLAGIATGVVVLGAATWTAAAVALRQN
jgi:hypothetical protein